MNQYPIKIQINNGHITVYSDTEELISGKCKGCGKDIFWVRTKFGKSMPVSKLSNGELVSHFADCVWASHFRQKNEQQRFQGKKI